MAKLYYDCFAGVSGDMNLGAMIDLGVSEDYLRSELSKLGIDEEFELVVKRAQKLGIEGTKVDVVLKKEGRHHDHGHKHGHDHGHKHDHHHHHDHDHHHDHHDHSHKHDHKHDHDHGHHHHSHEGLRNLPEIERIIDSSSLSDGVKALSKAIFMEIAIAEAKVHGKAVHEIHFHEVGAVDAIVDIVGAAICFEKLNVTEIISSPIQLGGGFVRCDHGMMPVPAPATAEILKGVPVKMGLVQKEMTTPTGAAIMKVMAKHYATEVAFTVEAVGYGLGTRDLDIPNVLRVMKLGDAEVKKNAK